ncbi:response regulator [Methanoplanus limicola]|uniref:Response regulator receiver n=1 Tax=Methanoplanus limicola DSM 2279 TaxID=937775 RepID=H1Z0K5_9EURY|nr:response regulator [Methanoplanus limicola]EHQ35262.1 response regulator receiver [Methanoplanus limicola DSM 2279]
MNSAGILLVDESRDVAATVSTMAAFYGHYICAHATTCREAMQFMSENSPDIIMIDIDFIRNFGGIKAAGHLRRYSHRPVIFLSTNPDSDDVKKAKKAGALGILKRPFLIQNFDVIQFITLLKRYNSQNNNIYDFSGLKPGIHRTHDQNLKITAAGRNVA